MPAAVKSLFVADLGLDAVVAGNLCGQILVTAIKYRVKANVMTYIQKLVCLILRCCFLHNLEVESL